MRVARRNLSSRARYYKSADAIIVSVPKSGRTWLRVFLYRYFSAILNRSFTLNEKEILDSPLPKLIFTHDLWEHRATARLKDRLRGKHLVPFLESREKRIVLLSRDPRDVVVSLFFQQTKRMGRYQGTLSDMIRHPKFGIGLIVDVMNTWMEEWGSQSNFKLLRYEDCQGNAAEAFRGVLTFLGFGEINQEAFDRSLEFSSFENMKSMERARQFGTGILLPGNPEDPESFKVRRGVVGGYREYLSSADIHYLDQAISRLDRRYGYDT
jgi:hypothetical protein